MRKILLTLLISLGPTLASWSQTNATFTRTEDVIYGRKFGTALTLDVFQPEKANGYGMICVVSGGWISGHGGITPAAYQAFLDRGYTVFAVVHGSQPKFTVPEIVQDMHRSVRFIRSNAKNYHINPDHIGISGSSAGGHLSLTLGTQGGPGDPKANDPIDRESSAVQAVACFFPPTDFLNYGKTGENGISFLIPKGYQAAFGPRTDTPDGRVELGREISPIYFITSTMPPTLILHGEADELVPIQQSESFVKAATEAGATARLVMKKGGGHGWPNLTDDCVLFCDWFDDHLRGIKK